MPRGPDPAARCDLRQTRMIKPARQQLPKDKPRVRRVPIECLQARASGSCTDSAAPRRFHPATQLAIPMPDIENVGMVREPAARGVSIPQPATLAKQPDWRLPQAVVRSRAAGSALSAGDGVLAAAMPKVLDGTTTLSRFPHTRKGLVPSQIGEAETESHLNEARATKGVVPENASLVAVFRRIPVELISRVRFDEGRGLLVFRLVSCRGRRLTRVYDVAAIRDASTGELHLVSHRTRNRAVVLS
jgi:hypothetical protein